MSRQRGEKGVDGQPKRVDCVVISTQHSDEVSNEKLRDGVWVHRNPLFILAVMAFLVGVQLLATGIIAELIIRTYYESQGKRAYSISASAGFDDETST